MKRCTLKKHLLTCIFFLLFSNTVTADEPPRGIITITPPKSAPSLILNNLDDEIFDLEKSRGHWVFVHFWASWCGPCKREMPIIQKLEKILDPKKLQIVLINTAENDETVFTFLGTVSPDLSTLMDLNGLVTESWSPRGLPATYLVDPEGKIRYQALGGRPWTEKPYLEFLRKLTRLKATTGKQAH
jgi:thiol-disulfide isomerase/thioredoxin